MIFLQLDKTHWQIQKAVLDFVRGEFKKEAIDRLLQTHSFPEDIWKKAGDIGLMGLNFPEEYDGQGLGMFETVLVAESLCRGDSSAGVCLAMAGSGINLILHHGTQAQKKTWLPKVARAEVLTCEAIAEIGFGQNMSLLKTVAVKEKDCWVINGTKAFVVNAGPLAGCYLVLCRTGSGDPPLGKAFSTLLVEADQEGITVADPGPRLGRQLTAMCHVRFDQVKVPLDNLVGREHHGLAQVKSVQAERFILSAAQSLGMAQGAFDRALSHVKQREQFGHRIVDFQITRQKLADMATRIEAARSLTYQAAWVLDSGQGSPAKPSAMAKLFAARTAVAVCDEAIQMMGGYGYMQAYAVERYFRDAKMADLFDGSQMVQKDIIASELVKGRQI